MPYIKFVCVHSTVEQSLRYILNPDKMDKLVYSDSLNCFNDAHCAYLNMKAVFEHHSTHKFNEPMPKTGKGTVKAILLLCQESGQVKQTKSYQLTSLRSETRDLLYNFSKSSGERYPQ